MQPLPDRSCGRRRHRSVLARQEPVGELDGGQVPPERTAPLPTRASESEPCYGIDRP